MTRYVLKRKNDEVIDAWDVSDTYTLNDGEEFTDRKTVRSFQLQEQAKRIAAKTAPPSTTTPTQSHPVPPSTTHQFILALLDRGRPKVAQLKCGIHNDTFYFGTTVPDAGLMDTITAVVTSERKICVDMKDDRQIKKNYGLHYRTAFEFEALDSHWSTQSIKRYLEGEQCMTLPELYESIKAVNKRFMHYPEEQAHEYVALDIISTYFLPCFEAKGRTFLEAEKGSGKTRQCTIYKQLCFNSIMSANISGASFFRVMESTCGTLIIDDFDSIGEEQKNDVLQHYKTGYKSVSKAVRTGEGRNRKQETFRTYGHVVMNNTSGLDPISADRTIYLPLIKTNGEITTNNINERSQEWGVLRGQLFSAALTYWREVRDTYDMLSSDVLSGRSFEISRAVLSLASIVSDELYNRLEYWVAERISDSSYFDPENDWQYQGLHFFHDKEDGYQVRPKAVAEAIALGLGTARDSRDWHKDVRRISTYLGKAVYSKMPGIFKPFKVQGNRVYRLVCSQKLRRYCEMKGWDWWD